MANEKAPKKEKVFKKNRKNQKHLANNFDNALAEAYKNEAPEVAEKVKTYLVMAAHGSETNWKPQPAPVVEPEAPETFPDTDIDVTLPVEPTAPTPADETQTEQPSAS